MIWKFLKQNVLFPKGLNWVQHCVSRIGLFSSSKQVLNGKAKQLPIPPIHVAGQGKRPNKARQVIFFMYLI